MEEDYNNYDERVREIGYMQSNRLVDIQYRYDQEINKVKKEYDEKIQWIKKRYLGEMEHRRNKCSDIIQQILQ